MVMFFRCTLDSDCNGYYLMKVDPDFCTLILRNETVEEGSMFIADDHNNVFKKGKFQTWIYIVKHVIDWREGEPHPRYNICILLQQMTFFLTFIYPETDDGKTEKYILHHKMFRNVHDLLNDVKLLENFKSKVKSKAHPDNCSLWKNIFMINFALYY